MDTKPVVIPHDRDAGPEPKDVTDETTTPDGGEAVEDDNTAPQRTRIKRNPDGTEVLEPLDGGKVA